MCRTMTELSANSDQTGSGVVIKKKECSRKHRNQNCTCSHKIGLQLSRRITSNKNRNITCQIKHNFYRKLTCVCRQPGSNTSNHKAKSQKLPCHNDHRNKAKPHKY